MPAACHLRSHWEKRTEPASEIYNARYNSIILIPSLPDRLSVCCLIVEKRADVVSGAKHGGMTAFFVIQPLECYCNAAACC